jgi:YfiH family protein
VPELLTAPALTAHGFRHGFSLRSGGVSAGSFATLNLGRGAGDSAAAVAENHRRFAGAVGFAAGALYETSQVHGSAVRAVAAGEPVSALRTDAADALIVPAGGLAIGVRVADCLPLLLADPESGAVAAVHAGWRGTVAGVVEAAVAALCALGGATSQRLLAATFPHIRGCCFEVGPDVADRLLAASPDSGVVDRTRDRPHVELQRVVSAKLEQLGVPVTNLTDLPGCTRCEPDRFFSYRRDGARSGRHIAAIVSRGSC